MNDAQHTLVALGIALTVAEANEHYHSPKTADGRHWAAVRAEIQSEMLVVETREERNNSMSGVETAAGKDR